MEQAREEERLGELHAEAHEQAEQAAGEAEEHGLEQVDLHDLGGAGAEGLHDGDGIHALGEVRADGHGHADSAEHERDEGHERKEAGGTVKGAGEAFVGFAVVGDVGVRE